MLVFSQDRDLRVQRKLHVVLSGAETLDLLVTAWLLTLEVVGGKAQYFQALVPLAFVQGFQSGVLGCQPAFGGDVDDQEHSAAVVGQTVRGAINACQRDLLQRAHGMPSRWWGRAGTLADGSSSATAGT